MGATPEAYGVPSADGVSAQASNLSAFGFVAQCRADLPPRII